MSYREKPITIKSSFEGYQYTIRSEYVTPQMKKINFKWILVIDGLTDEKGITIGAVYSEITDGKVVTMIDNLGKFIGQKHINGLSDQILNELRVLKEKYYLE